MGYYDFKIAPTDDLIRYLAAFSRFFHEAQWLCAARDYLGIVMIGNAAQALHNIPDHMRYYPHNSDTWYPRDGSWSAYFREGGAPDVVVAIWDEIFIPKNDQQELGLKDNLANWELPPDAAFSAFMELFHHACLEIRGLRSLRDHSVRPVNYYRINPSRVASMADDVIYSEFIARVLAPLPLLIAHWRSFDAAAFAESRRTARESQWPWWDSQFEAIEESMR